MADRIAPSTRVQCRGVDEPELPRLVAVVAAPYRVRTLKRILVLSLSGIGDTLMATPLLHELRLQFPSAEIDVLVLWAGAAEVLRDNPNVREVIRHDFLGAPRLASIARCLELRRRGYDLTINTHTQGRRGYRLIARLIGARTRLSHEYENQSWLDRWLVTRSLPQDYSVHVMENNARLLVPLLPNPGYEVFLADDERRWARGWLEERNLADRPWLGIHTGSGGTKNLALRRWPVVRYAALIREWSRRKPGIPVVLFGAQEERALHGQLRAAGAQFLEAESPGLREAMALVGHASGFLSVDTVFMHIAAAMGVRHQWVIETPTLNPPVHPRRSDWTLIPNPAIGGRHLEFYRYDGRPIAGTEEELVALMASVSVESVLDALEPWAAGL
jgi:ADP-heptose:LPS heptosyltransferase